MNKMIHRLSFLLLTVVVLVSLLAIPAQAASGITTINFTMSNYIPAAIALDSFTLLTDNGTFTSDFSFWFANGDSTSVDGVIVTLTGTNIEKFGTTAVRDKVDFNANFSLSFAGNVNKITLNFSRVAPFESINAFNIAPSSVSGNLVATGSPITSVSTNGSGDFNSGSIIWIINRAPTAAAGEPYLVAVGSSIAFDGSGSIDPDGDALTETWTADGGTVTGNVYTAGTESGIFDVCLTVNDGTEDSEPSCTIVVVYDPSGGFVTGGGWIDSPAGAYQGPNPGGGASQSGLATFGFVSKYKKGATVPSGNTEFQFHAAGFNFHSESYEWLVINQGGANAQFKGEGTVNGGLDPNGDTFKFMLWASDGSPDTFHIRIWWEDTDSTEYDIYDNGVDQAVGGGNIVVHSSK